ncbi:hypothetical protein IV102_03190 [bacterium]|nr:hypothetical protein [bacterium]
MTVQQILWQLHDLDQQGTRWNEQLERDGLSVYRQRSERARQALAACMQRMSEVESDLERRQQSLVRLESEIGQLQSELKSVHGYEASVLNHRLQPLLLHKGQQEEILLQLMLEQEETGPQLSPLRSEAEEAAQELEEARSEEQERVAILRQRLAQANEQRLLVAKSLEVELLAAYERGRKCYGLGLQEVKTGRCGRCRVEFPDHFQRLLKQGEGMACPTCQVVLVQPRTGQGPVNESRQV